MIETDRLILRPWRDGDIEPFHAMSRDLEVMRFIGPRGTRADAESAFARMTACQQEHGYCFWAVERRGDRAFLGFCGLKPGRAPIKGETEIGWRLAREVWGQGYAREAAQASLDWGWRNLDAAEIVAITVPANRRSRGLMERLGMVRDPGGDFDHLDAPEALRAHITYRIARPVHRAESPPA